MNTAFPPIARCLSKNKKSLSPNSIKVAVLALALGMVGHAVAQGQPAREDVTLPGDQISPIGSFVPVDGQEVNKAIDNTTSKYSNTHGAGSGFTIFPSQNPSVVTGLRFYTADDVPGRDPASYVLRGFVDETSPVVVLATGSLALPAARNAPGQPLSKPGLAFQEVNFSNTTHCIGYQLFFPSLKDPQERPMQIGEVEILGTIVQTPVSGWVTRRGAGVAGVKITATQNGAVVGTTQTASDGSYGFELKQGTYTFRPSSFASGKRLLFAPASRQVDVKVDTSNAGQDFIVTGEEVTGDRLRVTTTEDVVDNADGFVSLREAIAYANSNPDASTITFAPDVRGAIQVRTTDPTDVGAIGFSDITGFVITSDVTIRGPGAAALTVTMPLGLFRLFAVTVGARAKVSGLTLDNGVFPGGAVANAGALALRDCLFTNNNLTASAFGGAISNTPGAHLDVAGCTFIGNRAEHGGAIFNRGAAKISESSFRNNVSVNQNGAIENTAGATMELANCTFTGNTSFVSGGAVGNTGTLRATGCRFIKNSVQGNEFGGPYGGGGIANEGPLQVVDCTFSGNRAGIRGNGGGMVTKYSAVFLLNSTFSGNSAVSGGGLLNLGGALTMRNCTTNGNTASNNGGGLDSSTVEVPGNGAAPLAFTKIYNSTFSDNTAKVRGGGIYNSFGLVTLDSVTVSGNRAPRNEGGGIASYDLSDTSTRVQNSIVTGNLLPNGSAGTDVDLTDLSATSPGNFNSYKSLGANLIGIGEGVAAFNQARDRTNVTAAQIKLGPLADNGGTTMTRALLPGSIAIDAGQTSLTQDQRGAPRPSGGAADIGAFEVASEPMGAAGLVVTTTADTVADDGLISLREAIINANANGDNSTITFDAVRFSTPQQLATRSGEAWPPLGTNIKMLAPAAGVTISGSGKSRVFQVMAGATVSLSGLTITAGRSDDGGAIYNEGNLTLSNCCLFGNTASMRGSAVFNSRGTVTLLNSTVANGYAGQGGALYSTGALIVDSCTLAGNAGKSRGGIISNGGSLAIRNTILDNAGNIAVIASPEKVAILGDAGASAGVTDGGYNLVSDDNGILTAATDKLNTVPGLGLLDDNGGQTPTFALLPGSPAIDAGQTALAEDQRGVRRPQGAADDIGAYEFVADPTGEAGIVVTTLQDSETNDGLISLREAIINAERDRREQPITFAVAGTIRLTKALPDLVGKLSIRNSQVAPVVISGDVTGNGGGSDGDVRVFAITNEGDVSLQNLSIINGRAPNTDYGGGISNKGALHLSNCSFYGNFAQSGGAVGNGGALDAVDCIFHDNFAYSAGALANDTGTVHLTGCIFRNNAMVVSDRGATGAGGAIINAASMQINNCTFSGNSTLRNPNSNGGAISNQGTLEVTACTFADNSGTEGGAINNLKTLTVTDSDFSKNSAQTFGGAIENYDTAKLVRCAINQNVAAYGGGVDHVSGSLSLSQCTLRQNTAILSVAGTGFGGAIFTFAPLSLSGCTVSSNKADYGAAAYVYDATDDEVTPRLDAQNTTFTLNSASGNGGAIYSYGGLIGLTSCTLTANGRTGNGGVLLDTNVPGSKARIGNTIIVGNGSSDVDLLGSGYANAILSLGYNLIGRGTSTASFGASGDVTGVTAAKLKLGRLAANGGEPQTCALLAGSPALDAGKAFGLTVDQRGLKRPIDLNNVANAAGGDGSDIGAFEVQQPFATPQGLRPAPLREASKVGVSSATASVATGSITITFTGSLNVSSATDPANYGAAVNGAAVEVESAALHGAATVALGLPEGSLKAGDKVVVHYTLSDSSGRPLSGEVSLTAH